MKHPITTTTNHMKNLKMLSALLLLFYIAGSIMAQPCNDFTASVTAYETCASRSQCRATNSSNTIAISMPLLTVPGPGTHEDYTFDPNEPGIFTEYEDGTARLVAVVHSVNDPSRIFHIDLTLKDRKDWIDWFTGGIPTDHYRDDNGLAGAPDNFYENWSYYIIDMGLFSAAGSMSGQLIITHDFGEGLNHHGFQVGTAADNQTIEYGMSTDFQYGGVIDGEVIFGTDGALSMGAACTPAVCAGFANVTPSGGTPPYTYAWSNGEMAYNSTLGLCCGDYTVTVYDNNACQITENFSVGSCDIDESFISTTDDCEQQLVTDYATMDAHAIWLKDLPGSNEYVFVHGGGKFLQYVDGSAKLTGRVVNVDESDKQWDVELFFEEKRSWPEWQATSSAATYLGDPALVGAHFQNWFYYLLDSEGLKSKLTGVPGTFFEGATLYVEHDSDGGNTLFNWEKGAILWMAIMASAGGLNSGEMTERAIRFLKANKEVMSIWILHIAARVLPR